jgi:PAS domain S-box-containing protein
MSAGIFRSTFAWAGIGVAPALALLLLAATGEAHAARAWLKDLGDLNSSQRLWLAAFGGLSLGLAFGLIAFELRSRALAIALRRLTDLAAGVDGRAHEETQRQGVATELGRLSDEILYSAQRMARERREMNGRLAAWDGIFAAALDATIELDGKGNIMQMNPAGERLLRVKAQEVLGKPLVDVMLPPSHRSPDNACFARDLASGKAQGRRQELVAQRGDGRQFPLEVAIAEFGSGEQRGFIATARDISSQRRVRADLSRAQEHLERELAPLRDQIARLKQQLAQRAIGHAPANEPKSGENEAAAPARRPFTVDGACGDLIRKLVSRAERKGLGFRYEDSDVQGVSLLGDAARLRRVLVNLIDSVVRVTESGEIIVHIAAVPGEGRQIDLAASVTATDMTEEQAARMVRPFLNESVTRREHSPYPGRATTSRQIDFLGSRVHAERMPGGGSSFRFSQHLEADLSQVTFDVSAPPASAQLPLIAKRSTEPAEEKARVGAEFARAAIRLRRNADRINLGALWAESHRLKGVWLRHGDPAHAGLVSALAHTARGGDATNAVLLARRLADVLEQMSRRERLAAAAA